MPKGRPLSPLVLDEEQRGQLMALSRSTSMPHGLVQRARLILASAEGLSNQAVAERVGLLRVNQGESSASIKVRVGDRAGGMVLGGEEDCKRG